MEVELVKISPCRLYVCLKQCHAEPNHLSALCSTIRHNPACKRQHSLCRPEGWPGSRWVSRWPSGTCSCNRQHARGKPEANLCYSGHGGTNLQQKKKKKKKERKKKSTKHLEVLDWPSKPYVLLCYYHFAFTSIFHLCDLLSSFLSFCNLHKSDKSEQPALIFLIMFFRLKTSNMPPHPLKNICLYFVFIHIF